MQRDQSNYFGARSTVAFALTSKAVSHHVMRCPITWWGLKCLCHIAAPLP